MENDIIRWFGVVRKRTGKYIFSSAFVKEYPEQKDFLKKVLQTEKGDVVVELLQSPTWQPKDFVHYCNYHYVTSPSPKEREVTVPLSQYK